MTKTIEVTPVHLETPTAYEQRKLNPLSARVITLATNQGGRVYAIR